MPIVNPIQVVQKIVTHGNPRGNDVATATIVIAGPVQSILRMIAIIA
jgi:hypothetical protein